MELNKAVGARLKQVRAVFNEGTGLSAEQFSHLVGESADKIRNYESGRTAVPPSLLMELYSRGISPTWLVTGEGSRFAENEAGARFGEAIRKKAGSLGGRVLSLDAPPDNLKTADDDKMLKAAAGRAGIRNEREPGN